MENTKQVLEAIALRKCLIATYNRTQFKLAPHILYTRHEELYLDGVALERDGQPPREIKLGTFKLSGLELHQLSDSEFARYEVYDPHADKYNGTTLFAIELN
jgi:hypothetical protein